MAALDLLGRRWTLRVLWELRADAATFRGLQARCDGVSPSVLNQRLAELRQAGIIETDAAAGYRLSPLGQSLLAALAPLADWSMRWGRRRPGRSASVARGRRAP
jgi:DNA-binding HxlR family transcriptional regulator